ncbi:site-specific integrase [Kitasatospora sp. CB02891]|uniref:site-specific integrase n=1 Tax=Kitasatospora sp. CB02891 TaxID=2020329 RepID=UPI003511B875
MDPDLLDFVRSPQFRILERETKRNYATDIRPLLTFLSKRGVPWHKASRRDLVDYRDWRCRAVENPRRVGGTKRNREAAAFTRLFRWAKVEPLPVDEGRSEDRAADSVSSNVLWLTPRTWGLWSNIGLRGHTPAAAPTAGRYERLSELRVVTAVTTARRPSVEWVDRRGVPGRHEVGRLGWRERQLLFLDGPDGPEPAWLWLTEQGLPMAPERWNGVFAAANRRCEQVLLTGLEREVGREFRLAEVRGRSPYATPHAARHSYALYMLVLLNTLVEARFGLTKADRRDFALLFGDPWCW